MAFKVGVTLDLMTANGQPCFEGRAFDVLHGNPEIEWEWLSEATDEVTPDIAARYDGLHLNTPHVTCASLARSDCRLKVIARNGVGHDTVDLSAATTRGIIVTNTPIAVRRPVAVATLTMIFALASRLFKKHELAQTGRWNERANFMGQGLTGRTVGLVGAGGIGQEILKLARPFFARMVVADPYADAKAVISLGAQIVPLDALLREADFVVVCCLLNDETRHLIDATKLALMKPTAYYLNMARGPIHDEGALADALKAGRIAGAGLDVTENEPIEPHNPLLGMDNVIITPHALCWTDECFYEIAATALQSIVDVSLGRRPKYVVNPSALLASR
jgi:D-3-phosphoglycerate dehydrogenase